MALAGFVLGHLLVAAFVTASACVLGGRLLQRLRFQSPWEALAVSGVIGLGALGTLLFWLGLAGGLFRSSVLLLLLACNFWGWTAWRSAGRWLRGISGAAWISRRSALIALAAVAVAAPLVLQALYPPTQFDATLYHLPTAREFALGHRVSTLPSVRFVVFPQLNEMLFTAALLISDDLTAQLLELAFFALVALTILAWVRRFRPDAPVTGLAALALWLGSPILSILATSAYVEVALAAFASVAVYALACWLDTRERTWLLVAGLAAGFAAATKYQGLYFVAAIPAVVLLGNLRRADWRSALSVGAAAGAAALPWYVRNLLAARSPVWPFLGRIFGYAFWTEGDVASMTWNLRSFGGPRTVWSFLALPWTLAHTPAAADVLGLLFLLLPVTLFVSLRRARRRWLAALTLGYLVFWFVSSHQPRFLVPILPALSLLTAGAAANLLARLPERRRRLARTAWLCALLAFCAPALARPYAWLIRQGRLPLTDRERDAYLAARFRSYPVYAALNARLQGRYTIYAFHDERMKYYARGTHLGDWFGRGRYGDVALDGGRALAESLERLGADYLLVNEEEGRTPLPRDADFDARFTRIYRNGPITAYSVRRDKIPAGAPGEPLPDPSRR
jgi:Dolichyl-phosphate-mannose-protein mannosyltransferase